MDIKGFHTYSFYMQKNTPNFHYSDKYKTLDVKKISDIVVQCEQKNQPAVKGLEKASRTKNNEYKK